MTAWNNTHNEFCFGLYHANSYKITCKQPLKKLVHCLAVFCVFYLFCFELDVIFTDFLNIFLILVYKDDNCSMSSFALNYL